MYKRLFQFLKPHKGLFLLSMLCMIIFGATDGGVPFVIKYALDGVFANKDEALLKMLPFVIVGFALLRAVTDFGQQYLMALVGHRVVRDIRNRMNAHLLRLGPEYFVKNSAGELLTRFSSDTLHVRTLLTDTASAALRDAVRLVALIASSLYLDPFLALMSFVVFPIAILPIVRIGKKIRRLSRVGQDVTGSLSALLNESILGNRVVKIFNRETFESERFGLENEKLTRTLVRSERARALSGPINEILAAFAISGVLMYGGYSVIEGHRTPGSFIAFLISVFLMYDPFRKLSRFHSTVQQGLAGAERVFELLDTVPSVGSPSDPKPLPAGNAIVFQDVSFSYKREDGYMVDAVKNITLEIPEGKKIALVGFSGAGKSTLIDLIPRFIAPTKGDIFLSGTSLSELSLQDLRSRIALVGQHTFLFNDTIFNNIRYGKLDATEDEIKRAADTAYARDFIEKLPNGFNTIIGEAGLTLSGGERQRIAIARAVLKNAPILILDEATASLDNRSEREVQEALKALEAGRTTIVIAHRLSTIHDADLICAMSGGEIVERGTHQELMKKSGEYQRLQARGEGGV